MHMCKECGSQVANAHLRRSISKLEQRLVPGHPAPSGECPDCGGLCVPAWSTLPNLAPLTRWEETLRSSSPVEGPLKDWECKDLAALLQLVLERLADVRDHLKPRFSHLGNRSKISELCDALDHNLFTLVRAQILLSEINDFGGRKPEDDSSISEKAS